MTRQTLYSGLTISDPAISASMYAPNMLIISKPGTNNELLKINILYNVDGEMIKVNCPDDISDAFLHCYWLYWATT